MKPLIAFSLAVVSKFPKRAATTGESLRTASACAGREATNEKRALRGSVARRRSGLRGCRERQAAAGTGQEQAQHRVLPDRQRQLGKLWRVRWTDPHAAHRCV